LGFGSPPGYRRFLLNKLESANLEGGFVGSQGSGLLRHEGATGRTIENIANLKCALSEPCSSRGVDGLAPWVAFEPDSILLMAGTNNLRFFGVQKDFATDAESATKKLENLLNKIRQETATPFPEDLEPEIFVASIPYININSPFYEGIKTIEQSTLDKEIDTYNEGIKALVKSDRDKGGISHFVDANRLFRDGELTLNDLPDGVHPNANGYSKIADVWFEAIKPKPVEFNFTVENLTGSLAGQKFNGQFSFNSRRFTGISKEFFEVSDNLGDNFQIGFKFLGDTYTTANANGEKEGGFPFGVNYIDGEFDTLQFSHLAPINVPTADGFFDVFFEFGSSKFCTEDGIPKDPDDRDDPEAIASCQADFRYSFGINTQGLPEGSGIGSVKVEKVPEPVSTLGIFTFSTLGIGSVLKRKIKPHQSTEKQTKKVT
jgi:lysophospholipase L1-like esterase